MWETAVGKIGRWREIPRDFSLLIFYTLGSIILQTSNLLFCRHNKYIVCMMMRESRVCICELRKAGIYTEAFDEFFQPQTFFCWFQNFNKSCPAALARARIFCKCSLRSGHTTRQHYFLFVEVNIYIYIYMEEGTLHKHIGDSVNCGE